MNDRPRDTHVARQICRTLSHGTASLDEQTVARLRASRHLALERQAEPVPVLSFAGIGHGLSQVGQRVGNSLHNHYRGILAALALLIGALGADLWQNAQHAAELAEIDSILLSDDVPPGAYTDQGFLEWLEHFSSDEDQQGESLQQ